MNESIASGEGGMARVEVGRGGEKMLCGHCTPVSCIILCRSGLGQVGAKLMGGCPPPPWFCKCLIATVDTLRVIMKYFASKKESRVTAGYLCGKTFKNWKFNSV